MQNKIYLSDVVTTKDIDTWGSNDIVVLNAQTGCGKSYFVTNVLAEHRKQDKILLLSNRSALKEQYKRDFKDNKSITLITYQGSIKNRNNINLNDYSIIICDEAHYFFTDSTFNNTTDISLSDILNSKKLIIFMSATIDLLVDYLNTKDYNYKYYKVPINYDYINKIYIYKSEKALQSYLLNLPENEKAIYFSSTKKSMEMRDLLNTVYPNYACFICAKNNNYYKYSDKDILDNEILKEENFSNRVLCSTKVLDNGVNLKDLNIKTVIIDILDIPTFIQALGRKRCLNELDTITLIIKDKQKVINREHTKLTKELEQINYLLNNGQQEFSKEFYKQSLNKAIDILPFTNNLVVNEMMFIKYNSDLKFYKECLEYDYYTEVIYMSGYIKQVFNSIEKKYNFEELEHISDKITLEKIFDKLKGVKLFKEQQKDLIELIKVSLMCIPRNPNGSYKNTYSINTINCILEDRDMDYRFISKKENKGENRNKRYWIILSNN